MQNIYVDDSLWPVVQVTLVGRQTDDDVAYFSEALHKVWKRNEAFFLLVDVKGFKMNTAQIKRLAGLAMEYREVTEQNCICTAIILRSSAFRFGLSTLLLITPIPGSHEVFVDRQAAIAWMEGIAESVDISIGKIPDSQAGVPED